MSILRDSDQNMVSTKWVSDNFKCPVYRVHFKILTDKIPTFSRRKTDYVRTLYGLSTDGCDAETPTFFVV